MVRDRLSVLVHAYRHIHAMEDCNSSLSMKASLKAMEIISEAAGSEEAFLAARRKHRNHCKKCALRGFGVNSVPPEEQIRSLQSTVENLLLRARQLKLDEKRHSNPGSAISLT